MIFVVASLLASHNMYDAIVCSIDCFSYGPMIHGCSHGDNSTTDPISSDIQRVSVDHLLTLFDKMCI